MLHEYYIFYIWWCYQILHIIIIIIKLFFWGISLQIWWFRDTNFYGFTLNQTRYISYNDIHFINITLIVICIIIFENVLYTNIKPLMGVSVLYAILISCYENKSPLWFNHISLSVYILIYIECYQVLITIWFCISYNVIIR